MPSDSITQSSAHFLLGKWLHWALKNGHVYKDDDLAVETAALLFPATPKADLTREQALALLEKAAAN